MMNKNKIFVFTTNIFVTFSFRARLNHDVRESESLKPFASNKGEVIEGLELIDLKQFWEPSR